MMQTMSKDAATLDISGFMERNMRVFAAIALAMVVLLMLFAPETAHAAAGQLKAKGDEAIGWIRIGIGFILIIAVMGAGVLAAFGQMSWKTVGQVMIGCVIAGMATVVVTALFGS